MKTISFDRNINFLVKYKDIHLWENFVTGGFVIWMSLSGYNILLICCSVYPALILHKGLINMGSGLKFLDHATDDPTGKTYGIPLLGIKVPRMNTKMRLIFACLSIVAAVVIMIEGWNISVQDYHRFLFDL